MSYIERTIRGVNPANSGEVRSGTVTMFCVGMITKIRSASLDDIPAMMGLAGESCTAAHWGEEDYRRIFVAGLPSRMALVAENSEGILGFIVTAHVAEEWELENIAVAPKARRQGIASSLTCAFLESAKSQGGRSVFLEVRESNEPARALYSKWGFVVLGQRKEYYSNPVEDALIYQKLL